MAMNTFIPKIPVCDWTAILVARRRPRLGRQLGRALLARGRAGSLAGLGSQKAGLAVVIYHAYSLQKCIDDRTAYETKAPFLEVLREAVAQFRARRETLASGEDIDDRFPIYKVPQV